MPAKMKITTGAVIEEPGNSVKNKTADWRILKPLVDEKKCTRCGICWQYCPDASITVTKEKGAVIDHYHCKGCGIYANECPVKAIVMVKEEK